MDGDSSSVEFFGRPLPPLCTFKALTGWDCPGCGLTRSFVFMGSGSVIEAFRVHLFGPVLWVAVAAQIPYRLIGLYRDGKRG